MRPPAIERMGYYPTDEPVVEIIRTYLKPPAKEGGYLIPAQAKEKLLLPWATHSIAKPGGLNSHLNEQGKLKT